MRIKCEYDLILILGWRCRLGIFVLFIYFCFFCRLVIFRVLSLFIIYCLVFVYVVCIFILSKNIFLVKIKFRGIIEKKDKLILLFSRLSYSFFRFGVL